MCLLYLFTVPSVLLLVLCAIATQSSAYFLIEEPNRQTEWSNGRANLATWEKGELDGIHGFDIELARLSQNGITYVARNVPASQKSLNLELQGVPPGDDYFMTILNATHGVMYKTSPRFTILPSGTSPSNGPQRDPDPSVPTVTVSGAPNPTQHFFTTYPAIEWEDAAMAGYGWTPELRMKVWSWIGIMVISVLSALWTLC